MIICLTDKDLAILSVPISGSWTTLVGPNKVRGQRKILRTKPLRRSLARPKRYRPQGYYIWAKSRHLGPCPSLADLRSAVGHWQRLDAALDAHPADQSLLAIYVKAKDQLVAAAIDRGTAGLGKPYDGGSIVIDLDERRELEVGLAIVDPRNELRARAWLARRGTSTKLDGLRRAVVSALMRGDFVPNELTLWRSIAIVCDRVPTKANLAIEADLREQLREAVARYERAKMALEAHSDSRWYKHEVLEARHAILELSDQLGTEQKDDGSWSCDLGDGRKVVVRIVLDKKLPKELRRDALAFLRGRGKKRLEHLAEELRKAPRDEITDLLFDAISRIEILIHQKYELRKLSARHEG
jgi:hypothetical protein